jgi:ABC-type nitrate/sulfonate/bicarbonate transport system substrate-binding protein
MDHVVAIEKGYLSEEGLNVKILRSGGGSATQTLLSGQIHFSSSAGSALSAALRGGPVKIIYTNQSRPTYKLLSNKPEIKTLQDLIGKKIAINTFGNHFSSSLYAARLDSRRSSPAPWTPRRCRREI